MELYRAKNYKDLSRKAANIISAQIIMKRDSVLGLATGSSPIGTYHQLIDWYEKGDIDFSQVKSVNLDEYKGISGENVQSYAYYMRTNFFDHINIQQKNTFIPDGMTEHEEAECRRYDRIIASLGGIDLQLLGLGHNGHIGFNEPQDTLEMNTHCVKLSESTIQANARLFDSEDMVPQSAYTVGMKTILQAKKIVIIASGMDKADIVKKAFWGPVTSQVPASVLQLHPNVVLIGDEEALSKIG